MFSVQERCVKKEMILMVDFTARKREKLNEIIRIMNIALHKAEPSSSCETYIGHSLDMLKKFRDEEL